jgi:hypothetical protein
LPVIIVGGSAMMYLVRKQATKRALGTATDAERKHANSKLFDFVDADSSGFVDPKEFKIMLKE